MLVKIENEYYEASRVQKVEKPYLFIKVTKLSDSSYKLIQVIDDLSLQEDCGLTDVIIRYDKNLCKIDLTKYDYVVSYGFSVHVDGKGLNMFDSNYKILVSGFKTMLEAAENREKFVKEVNEKNQK